MITDEHKRRCLLREILMRSRVYPKRVAEGKMRQQTADFEIAVMKAILDDYTMETNDDENSQNGTRVR